jgi:hypothetical protein
MHNQKFIFSDKFNTCQNLKYAVEVQKERAQTGYKFIIFPLF